MRIGIGFDVHAFVVGRPLILGGVQVEHPYGLQGHSDADVLCHAIADACLGACALGDIGQHFSDQDPQYEGADSLKLLSAVEQMCRNKGWVVSNVDATLVAQVPRLAPYVGTMASNIAAALKTTPEHISVKATTTEHLGFTGRKEGIAAMSTALMHSP